MEAIVHNLLYAVLNIFSFDENIIIQKRVVADQIRTLNVCFETIIRCTFFSVIHMLSKIVVVSLDASDETPSLERCCIFNTQTHLRRFAYEIIVGQGLHKTRACSTQQGPLLLRWFNFNPSMNK